ncbi:unnamed protein product [Adineta steineri]|uniref:Uncharacterized protein n=1 Tax=Adineta steineri TaxID=433720 RepID=A0A818KRF1_9BILA|nr:unnamed protein product [Adineta steineri]CAF3562531.1 unnamed protein product [Adineta steineri]
MSNESNRFMEDEIERIFNGQTSITKEKMKQALEEFRMGRGSGNRGRGGMNRPGPIRDEMKQKLTQLLESELDKINSDTITKEQAKSTLLSFGSQAKEQWHTQIDNYIQTSIKDELSKLNVQELNANQARDLLRNISNKMRPSHGGGPSLIDDNIKHEFMNEFKTKYGTNKINADEAWEMIKIFDKNQHDKLGCCEKRSDGKEEKDKKWEELFDEQFKELYGDLNKTKINQQQLEDLAKKIKEKLRQECPQHPGKRFCQH